jgi:protein arginine kinase activator
MQCENCGERPAAIHLTQIVNNTVTQQHLCEVCAAEKGVHTEASVAKFPLSDFLASMGEAGAPAAPAADAGACAACGATLQDFQDTGRLGCPECYTTFATHLRTLLRRVHGASQHVGAPYRSPADLGAPPAAAVVPPDLTALREGLQRAVAAEDFELAARLRDQIRALE